MRRRLECALRDSVGDEGKAPVMRRQALLCTFPNLLVIPLASRKSGDGGGSHILAP